MAPNNCATCGGVHVPGFGAIAIDISHLDDVCIVHCQGRLLAGVEDDYIRAKIEYLKQLKCARVLADFAEVPSIGSSGVAFIIGIYTSVVKTPGGRFVLVGAAPLVKRVLEITKLNTVIPQAADFGSGLASLRS